MELAVLLALIAVGVAVLWFTGARGRASRSARAGRDAGRVNSSAELARQQTEQAHRVNGVSGQF